MRQVCGIVVALLVLLGGAVGAAARCGAKPGDAPAVAAVESVLPAQCRCCGPVAGYRRCVASLVRHEVRAKGVPRTCKGKVKRDALVACPLPRVATACNNCSSDVACNDGNPCTVDRCVDGTCEHGCICVEPGSALGCCGPGPLCVTNTTTTNTVQATTTTTQPAQTGNDWRGVYGAWGIFEGRLASEMATLKSLGINTVVQNIGLAQSKPDPHFPGWQQFYDAAVQNGINLIPILWDGSKNQSVWNWTGSEFKLDIHKYPTDPGAQFLSFLQANPTPHTHTVAVYSVHEPFNPGNGNAQRSVLQNQTLWKQFHAMFGDSLPLYGESITHVDGCENGCVDYAGLGVYSFASCSGKPLYAAVDVVPAADGVDFSTELCVTSAAEVIQRATAMLDAMYNRSHNAQPAPDGTFTKFLPLIQTFVAPLPEVSRMPSPAEMQQWVEQIVLARRDKVVGVTWYCWDRASSTYETSLEYSQFDPTGTDRWQTVKSLSSAVNP